MTEHRSWQSRVYRFLLRKFVLHVAASLFIAGWALVLFAAPAVDPNTDMATHVQFVVYLLGALVTFGGATTLFVSIVLGPAIERRFKLHIEKGVTDHKDLLDKAEYARKHDELKDQLSAINVTLGVLADRLKVERDDRRALEEIRMKGRA